MSHRPDSMQKLFKECFLTVITFERKENLTEITCDFMRIFRLQAALTTISIIRLAIVSLLS